MTASPPKRGPDQHYAGGDYTDGRLSAAPALRNRDDIARALVEIAPETGTALEIASGTGEHVIRFAPVMPGLTWQPSDPAPDRRASIAAWLAAEPAANIHPPVDLDACTPGWADIHGPVDLVFAANLLHLVTEAEARICLFEMAAVLAPGGRAVVYGPFLRNGRTTSDGDAAFDARIRMENPEHGYKDMNWVTDMWAKCGLEPEPPRDMPANNLLLVARRPTPITDART